VSEIVGAAQGLAIQRSSLAPANITDIDWVDSQDELSTLVFQPSKTDPLAGWAWPWWPARGVLYGDTGIADVQGPSLGYQDLDIWLAGANGRLGFAGITRDQYGSALGNCTVRLVRVSTNEIVAQVTSDANGAFTITTPYLDAHFLTVHKSGTPDVAGASVDTLIPG